MSAVKTIILSLLAALAVTMSVFLAVDGNLSRITGWYRFEPGMPLFSESNLARLADVDWMRIRDLHDEIVCHKDERGVWWIEKPFRDRMSAGAAEAILTFTAKTRLVDTLPLNNTTRESLREFGVETTPHTITLKAPAHEGGRRSTVARFTLGSVSPWMADAGNGKDIIPTVYLRTDFYGRDKRIHVVTCNILPVFKEGLESLRDPHPLLFDPDSVLGINIHREGHKDISLQRISAEADWTITAPVLAAADRDKTDGVLLDLLRLRAKRVLSPADAKLPEQPEMRLQLRGTWGEQPMQIDLYPEFVAESDKRTYRYAKVPDRDSVFLLQAREDVQRGGSYATLLNGVLELPVLPEKAIGQIKSGNRPAYTRNLELTADDLRSLQFSDLAANDVARVSIRSMRSADSIRLVKIPGNTEGGVNDEWMYAEGSRPFLPAENNAVVSLLRGMKDIPVDAVAADAKPGEDTAAMAAAYGLDTPTYVLSVLPNPCNVRAIIFGCDLPLVKDREARTFLISRHADPATGKGAWFGMELGGSSVYRLNTKFTRLVSLRAAKWKSRNITKIPIAAVRRLTLGYKQAPLVMDYDHIGEAWTGKLGDKDVTPNINIHRAEYYLRSLQQLKVSQWLDSTDEDALKALEKPVFSVKVEMEIADTSAADRALMDDTHPQVETTDGTPEELLNAASEEDPFGEPVAAAPKTHRETRTIEIVPGDNTSDTPFFYGRLRETGELFILRFEDAQGLAGDMLDL